MVTEDLAVPYYQQETDYYCGAACAKMVLEEIGAGALDQDDLYNDNHSHSVLDVGVNWATGPDGLNWTMNARKPATFGNFFVLFSEATEDAISRKIAWTIHHYQVAPIALVYGWQHWIVVRGYEASAAPTGPGDLGMVLSGLFINNPWPPVGTMGAIADEHISYSTWTSTYMTGVPGGVWNGRFLAVCDPEPAAKEIGRREVEPGEGKRRELLTPDEAGRFALEGVKRHSLFEHEQFARALEGADPAGARLVQRLDRTDSFYYLVPMVRDRRPSAVVSVGALDARYHQASIVSEDGGWDLSALDRDVLTKRFVGQLISAEGSRSRIRVRKGAVCIYPCLVWKPCRESLSPNYPFAMITVGDRRFYIRSDGRVFTQLHDLEPGI